MKIQKKIIVGDWGVRGDWVWCRYERRFEDCVKIKKKSGGGGQGRCERRSEVFVKIQKKKIVGSGRGMGSGLWGGGGVRMDVKEELKFL